MDYMSNHNNNVVFLTFDTTKEDWMTILKEPYLHYLENVYYNTGKILNILDADRTLEKVLEVDLDSLIEVDNDLTTNTLSIFSLMNYCQKHPLLKRFEKIKFTDQHISELNSAGYETIEDINSGVCGMSEEYLMSLINQKITYLGALRFALIPFNKNYKLIYLRLSKKWISPPTKYDEKYFDWLTS